MVSKMRFFSIPPPHVSLTLCFPLHCMRMGWLHGWVDGWVGGFSACTALEWDPLGLVLAIAQANSSVVLLWFAKHWKTRAIDVGVKVRTENSTAAVLYSRVLYVAQP